MTIPSPDSTVREPVPAGCTVRFDVGPTLRLAEMAPVQAAIRAALCSDPLRIVIDARNLQTMTRGAYLALVGATVRLERAGVELVVERCAQTARPMCEAPTERGMVGRPPVRNAG